MTKSSIVEKMNQFEALIAWFQSEDFEIDKAVDKLAEADRLATEIEQQLSSVKNEIEVIRQKFD